jgi:hypothetical protein
MFELLFLLGFSLHNLEEAIWLPEWSKQAKGFHKPVSKDEFYFAVICVTAIGYLITFQYFLLRYTHLEDVSKLLYLGFIMIMVLNAVFPHLAATIRLRQYAPGTITAIVLNLPIGLHILHREIHTLKELLLTVVSGIPLALVVLFLIRFGFRFGKKLGIKQ